MDCTVWEKEVIEFEVEPATRNSQPATKNIEC